MGFNRATSNRPVAYLPPASVLAWVAIATLPKRPGDPRRTRGHVGAALYPALAGRPPAVEARAHSRGPARDHRAREGLWYALKASGAVARGEAQR
jgi:hypothetical protein